MKALLEAPAEQLRRSTFGTAPSKVCQIGTKVLDQGSNQNIPYKETILQQTHYTSENLATYNISTTSFTTSTVKLNYLNEVKIINTVTSDGITLPVTDYIRAIDTVLVIYGGRSLRKEGQYYQDISLAFDNYPFNIKGSTSTENLLPINAVQYDAYLVTATNQVWIYTDSKKLGSINGFEFNGLNYLPPEFSIDTSTKTLNLHILGGIKEGIELKIVKKEFRRDSSWNNELTTSTTLSLLDSDTLQAIFLQQQPAELPDKYYYGGT